MTVLKRPAAIEYMSQLGNEISDLGSAGTIIVAISVPYM